MCNGALEAFSKVGESVADMAGKTGESLQKNYQNFSDNPVKETLAAAGTVMGLKKDLGLAIQKPLGLTGKDANGEDVSLLPSSRTTQNNPSTPTIQTPEAMAQQQQLASQVKPAPIGQVSIPPIKPLGEYYSQYLQQYGGING